MSCCIILHCIVCICLIHSYYFLKVIGCSYSHHYLSLCAVLSLPLLNTHVCRNKDKEVLIHTYVHTYTYMQVYTHIHTYILTYLHTYIHTFIHSFIHTYIHSYIHTYVHTYITYQHTYFCRKQTQPTRENGIEGGGEEGEEREERKRRDEMEHTKERKKRKVG